MPFLLCDGVRAQKRNRTSHVQDKRACFLHRQNALCCLEVLSSKGVIIFAAAAKPPPRQERRRPAACKQTHEREERGKAGGRWGWHRPGRGRGGEGGGRRRERGCGTQAVLPARARSGACLARGAPGKRGARSYARRQVGWVLMMMVLVVCGGVETTSGQDCVAVVVVCGGRRKGPMLNRVPTVSTCRKKVESGRGGFPVGKEGAGQGGSRRPLPASLIPRKGRDWVAGFLFCCCVCGGGEGAFGRTSRKKSRVVVGIKKGAGGVQYKKGGGRLGARPPLLWCVGTSAALRSAHTTRATRSGVCIGGRVCGARAREFQACKSRATSPAPNTQTQIWGLCWWGRRGGLPGRRGWVGLVL